MIWECTVITFVAALVAGGIGFFAGMGYQRGEDFREIRKLRKQIETMQEQKKVTGITEIPTKEIKYGGF